MNKNFNLVFNNWEGGKILPNGIEYPELNSEIPYYILNDARLKPKIFKLEDVTPNQDFFYILDYRSDLSFLLSPKFFIIPDEIIKISREKNLKIMLLNEHEVNVQEYRVMKIIIYELRKRGVKEENFYYINNNSKLRFYKEKLNSNINVYTSKFLCDFICSILLKNPVEFVLDKDFLFLCHNRTGKGHRLLTLAYLKKYDILKNTDYSLVGNMEYTKNMKVIPFKYDTYKDVEEELNFFRDGEQILSKCEENKKEWFINPDEFPQNERLQLKCYTNSYINITTESIFNWKEVHISEKSFKPFYFLQIPIFIAGHHHVEYLKKTFGFDLFEDLIDHSYDTIYDDDERFLKVINEIKRLNDNKVKVKEFYKNNIHRLISNNKIISTLYKENRCIKDFKYISKIEDVTIVPDPVIKMKKVLITGCNGLVGKFLVRKCIEKSYDVVGVDITDYKADDNDMLNDFKFIKMDLTVEENIKYLFNVEKPDFVLNTFGIKGSPLKAKEKPMDFLYPSLKVNTEIINECAKRNIWLIYVSSVGVYGGPEESFIEDNMWKKLPTKSDWFPSWSKRYGEILLEACKIQYNYENWAIIRPANIFGDYDDFSGNGTVISTMIKKITEAEEFIEAWGDGTPIRDFVYAPDVADAILKLYEKNLKTTIVNFGSGEERSIANIIENIIGISGKKIDIHWDKTKPNGDVRRKMNTDRQKELDLMPKTSFTDALNKTYNYYKRLQQKKII